MTDQQLDPSDAAAIDGLMDAWTAAYEQGNASAISALYDEDADVVLINGQHLAGRESIEAMYRTAFDRLPGNRARIVSESRRLIGDGIVVEDSTWEVVGALPEDAPARGRSTAIFRKRDQRWLILCVRSMVPVAQTALD